MRTTSQLLRRIQVVAINQIPIGLDGNGGSNPLPDEKACEQPLVKPVTAWIADINTEVGSGDRNHLLKRFASAERE